MCKITLAGVLRCVIAALTLAAVWASFAAQAAAQYNYVATTQAKAADTREPVKAGSLTWECEGNQCRISGPWPAPGRDACRALAQQGGPIVSYGRPGRWLSEKELDVCNEGIAATSPVDYAPGPLGAQYDSTATAVQVFRNEIRISDAVRKQLTVPSNQQLSDALNRYRLRYTEWFDQYREYTNSLTSCENSTWTVERQRSAGCSATDTVAVCHGKLMRYCLDVRRSAYFPDLNDYAEDLRDSGDQLKHMIDNLSEASREQY